MNLTVKTFIIGLLVAAAMSLSGVALAQSGGNVEQPRNPNIQGSTETRGEAESSGGTLPFTGADVTLFALIGLAAIGTGMMLVRSTRARQSS
jgi:hypothetical protein